MATHVSSRTTLSVQELEKTRSIRQQRRCHPHVEATQAPTKVQLAVAQSWAAGVLWARMGLTHGTMEQIPEYVRALIGADSNGVHEGHTAVGHKTGYLAAGTGSAPDAQPWGRDSPQSLAAASPMTPARTAAPARLAATGMMLKSVANVDKGLPPRQVKNWVRLTPDWDPWTLWLLQCLGVYMRVRAILMI